MKSLQRLMDEPDLLPRLQESIVPVERVEHEITELIEIVPSLFTGKERSSL